MYKSVAILLLIIASVGAEVKQTDQVGPPAAAGTEGVSAGATDPDETPQAQPHHEAKALDSNSEKKEEAEADEAEADTQEEEDQSHEKREEAHDKTEPVDDKERKAEVEDVEAENDDESSDESEKLKKKINDETGKKGEVWDVSMKCRDCLCYFATDCALERQCEKSNSIFGLEMGMEKGNCGPFHISFPFWADANNVKMDIGDANMEQQWRSCSIDLICATDAIQNYFHKYHVDCNGDGKVDCIDYAAIHTLGPYGCKVPEKLDYWNRARRKEMLQCMVSVEEGAYTKKMKEKEEENNKLKLQDFTAWKLAEIEKNKSSDMAKDSAEKPENKVIAQESTDHENIRGGIIHL